MHSLKGLPHVIDIRNIGLIGAIEFEPAPGEPAKRAYDRFVEAFKSGLLVAPRATRSRWRRRSSSRRARSTSCSACWRTF